MGCLTLCVALKIKGLLLIGRSVIQSLALLHVEGSLGKILNPEFPLMHACASAQAWTEKKSACMNVGEGKRAINTVHLPLYLKNHIHLALNCFIFLNRFLLPVFSSNSLKIVKVSLNIRYFFSNEAKHSLTASEHGLYTVQ